MSFQEVTPTSKPVMPEHECKLFHLPQELQDQIFDNVVDEAEVIFCHPKGSAISTSKILIAGPKFHANYKSALRRRVDKFPNHRISVDFQLCGKQSTTPLTNVNISLPLCATGLHIFIQVTKSGVLCTGGTGSTLVSGLHDISKPIKTLVNTINVEHLLIELQVIDPAIGTKSKSSNQRKTGDAYHRLLRNLFSLDWSHRNNTSKLVAGALVTHNGTGQTEIRDRSGAWAGHWASGRYWPWSFDGNDLTTDAAALADIFHARARIEQAVKTVPVQQVDNERAARASARGSKRAGL